MLFLHVLYNEQIYVENVNYHKNLINLGFKQAVD